MRIVFVFMVAHLCVQALLYWSQLTRQLQYFTPVAIISALLGGVKWKIIMKDMDRSDKYLKFLMNITVEYQNKIFFHLYD